MTLTVCCSFSVSRPGAALGRGEEPVVTLASAFLELDHAASRLEERFGHLHWAVMSSEQSDLPTVVHQWHDLSTDFSDLARELAATARLGRLAVNGRSGLQGAHGALARCQECYGTLWLRYCADGLSPGGRRGLDSLRRRGDPLTDWAKGVADANDRCLEPLHEVGLALGRTWQELVERAWLGLLVQSPGLIESSAGDTAEPVTPVVAQDSSPPVPGENEAAGA